MARSRPVTHTGKTLILIPFPEANCSEHLKSTKGEQYVSSGGSTWTPGDSGYTGWKAASEDVLCSDNPRLTTKLNGLSGVHDVLYIRGHGGAGDRELESSDHTRQIDVKGLLALLKGKLRPAFPGIIKICACESGLPLDRSAPFCQQFADAMYAAGFHACSYYGYQGTLSTAKWQPSDLPLQSPHKLARGGR
jgi:hypothetical protein